MLKLVEINGISFEVLQKDDIRRLFLRASDVIDIDEEQYLCSNGVTNYDLITAIGMDKNKVDLAYPQQWRDMDHNVDYRFKSGDYAFWTYEYDSVFGGPIWFNDIMRNLKALIHDKITTGDYQEERD